MKNIADFIVRLGNAIMDTVNRSKKKDAANNAADTIANNDAGVRESETSFDDLASKSKRDQAK